MTRLRRRHRQAKPETTMIFPIGDDQVKGGYFPLLSYSFILLNIAVFVLQANMTGGQFNAFVNTYGSIPAETVQGEDLFTLITSMFLHGSWMHLIGNMLFLWVFADNIEATIGNFRFFVFYLLGGLAAHAAHIYFNWGSPVPTVGASGAISAVLGAYLVMFPTSRVKLLFIVFPFRLPAVLFLGIWFWMQWQAGSAMLQGADDGVAYWAHIGGFVFGLVMGLYYRLRYRGAPREVGGEEYV